VATADEVVTLGVATGAGEVGVPPVEPPNAPQADNIAIDASRNAITQICFAFI
jgi:hypothetical protein